MTIPYFNEDSDFLLLLCPYCGNDYTHYSKVEIFERENATFGLHTTVTGLKTKIDTDISKNPSWRQDGLSITFGCECCEKKFKLDMMQHKGQTNISVNTEKL